MITKFAWVGVGLLLGAAVAWGVWQRGGNDKAIIPAPPAETGKQESGTETATFGGGCFWCTEAVFLQLKGVKKVVSGYSGGKTKNPTYEEICTGTTGHAEVIQVTYDKSVVSYATLLQVFWQTHDPTTLNRQGNDKGTQYRSVIFYHNDEQKALAETYKKKINEAKVFADPVVTEISPYATFYKAEDYHQNFFAKNPDNRYCQVFIPEKLEKLKKIFGEKVKTPGK